MSASVTAASILSKKVLVPTAQVKVGFENMLQFEKVLSSMFTNAACVRISVKGGMHAHMQACMFNWHLLHQIIPLHFL